MKLADVLSLRRKARSGISIGDTPPSLIRDSNLTEHQLSMLQKPTAARQVPVKMDSMGGVVIYVSNEQTARSLSASDAASVATAEAIKRHL